MSNLIDLKTYQDGQLQATIDMLCVMLGFEEDPEKVEIEDLLKEYEKQKQSINEILGSKEAEQAVSALRKKLTK